MALSGIAGNDLYGMVRKRRGLAPDPVASRRIGRFAVVGFAVLAAAIALDPPKLLGIFGQLGTYGVVAGAAAPPNPCSAAFATIRLEDWDEPGAPRTCANLQFLRGQAPVFWKEKQGKFE